MCSMCHFLHSSHSFTICFEYGTIKFILPEFVSYLRERGVQWETVDISVHQFLWSYAMFMYVHVLRVNMVKDKST